MTAGMVLNGVNKEKHKIDFLKIGTFGENLIIDSFLPWNSMLNTSKGQILCYLNMIILFYGLGLHLTLLYRKSW